MTITVRNITKVLIILVFGVILSCSKDDYEIEYAEGYPNILAGNWVVFQFQGGTLDGVLTGPYDMSTALDPNRAGSLILDNISNTGNRARAEIVSDNDTGWFNVQHSEQLEVINKGNFGIETISIDGYINDNPVLINYAYRLATQAFENIAFRENDISEIIFLRTGLYDQYKSLADTFLIVGYRKTGFEESGYNN